MREHPRNWLRQAAGCAPVRGLPKRNEVRAGWGREKKVKHACTPDSVRGGCPPRDRHQSGPPVARTARCYLPVDSAGRLVVHLLGIAARRDCPFHPPWMLVPSAFAYGAAPR